VTSDLIRDPAGVVYSHRSPDGNWLPGELPVLVLEFSRSNFPDAISTR